MAKEFYVQVVIHRIDLNKFRVDINGIVDKDFPKITDIGIGDVCTITLPLVDHKKVNRNG